MNRKEISLSLGSVDHSSLVSDADFQQAARKVLPQVIERIGASAAEEAWTSLQKAFKGPGFKANTSSSDKSKFIRETAQNYCRKITTADKKKIEDEIILKLRELKKPA